MGWSDKSVTALKKLWADGKSASEIARALKATGHAKSREAVIGKIFRLGLSDENRTDGEEAEAAAYARKEKNRIRSKKAYRRRKLGDGR